MYEQVNVVILKSVVWCCVHVIISNIHTHSRLSLKYTLDNNLSHLLNTKSKPYIRIPNNFFKMAYTMAYFIPENFTDYNNTSLLILTDSTNYVQFTRHAEQFCVANHSDDDMCT